MNKTFSLLFCLCAISVVLPACSGEDQDKAKRASPIAAQTEALQKARQAEKAIEHGDAERRRQLQEQGL